MCLLSILKLDVCHNTVHHHVLAFGYPAKYWMPSREWQIMKYTEVILTFFIELQFYANLRHATGKNSYFVFHREIQRFLNYKLSVPACCLQFPRCLSTGETAIAFGLLFVI